MPIATTTSLAVVGSPNTDDIEIPFHSQQTPHFSSFPKEKNHLLQPPPTLVTYKQCLKNHAAAIGSHALDGCGEFLPSLTSTPHEPTSLKCAVCGCHRNFHRREIIDHDHIHTHATHAPNALISLRTLAAGKSDSPRKRFRTKFSEPQKEKMYIFAEKMGWKMQGFDDEKVTEFCNEIGIKRGVFKVWMHNNKHTLGKKDKETASPTTAVATEVYGNKIQDVYNVNVDGHDNNNISNSGYQENGVGGGGGCVNNLHATNNGLSSS